MKDEYAINFSEYEVRAALEGRKAQARRIVKPVQSTPRIPPLNMYPWLFSGDYNGEHDDEHAEDDDGRPLWVGEHPDYPHKHKWFTCPFGKVGTRLWARETFRFGDGMNRSGNPELPTYKADWPDVEGIWRSSTQMPRWASRLTFEIVNVRVERVQDITIDDVIAEGVFDINWTVVDENWRKMFALAWNAANGKGAWERNNWVWVLELKRVEEKI